MEKIIKRLVLKMFPELSARYHLPVFAEVVGVRETPTEGDVCNEFRPYYAVDVQVLDEHGKPDHAYPIFKDVILSLPVAGHEMGQFAYPENGTWVEIAFAYGSPNKPFIRSVVPHQLTLPPLERGEQRWQHNPESFQRADKDGNWQRKTDLDIHDKSLTRLIEALDVVENFHRSVKNTETNDTEIIGAIKRIEAFGAIVFQSGGVLDLSSVNHLRLTTKAKAIIHTLGDFQATIEANKTTQVNGTTQHFSDVAQHLESPKSWIGSSSENLFKLVSELAGMVIDLSGILAAHKHPAPLTPPVEAADISGVESATSGVQGRVNGITE